MAALVLLTLAVAALVGCAGHDVVEFETQPVPVRSHADLVDEISRAVESNPALTLEVIGIASNGSGTGPVDAVPAPLDGTGSRDTADPAHATSRDSSALPIIVVHYDGTDASVPHAGGSGAAERTATDRPSDPASRAPRILVTGGVHGNEPAGVEWTVDLIQELAERPAWADALVIDVVPVVNPWGWVHDVRYNADGRDINRDFAAFRTPEARAVRDLLAGQSYDLVIDDHEDPGATGVYIYQYGLRDDDWSREVIADLRSRDYPIEQDVNMIILRTDDGLIDAPMWGLRYMRMTDQLSLTNYIRLQGTRLVYTFETPTRLPLERRVAAHARVFDMLVGQIGGSMPQGQ